MKNLISSLRFAAVFLSLAWAFGLSPGARAQGVEGVTVTSIEVRYVGPETVAKDRVLANMRTKVGQPYSETTVEDDIRTLYDTGKIQNVRIFGEPAGNGVRVQVILATRALITEIEIDGATSFKASKVRSQIKFKVPSPSDAEKLEEGRQNIIDFYQRKGFPGVDVQRCRSAFTDPTVWDGFDPATLTLCSPDPQAFRPPEDQVNVLQVRLPTNFKSARFVSDADTEILRRLAADIEAARFETDGERIELPVKLKVHESVFVPLAKWSMLIAGNYRCVQKDAARSIRDAVHGDLEQTRAVYAWVFDLCVELGAAPADLVPFEKYAQAADSLVTPSSAARALFAGAPYIERVDRLVQAIAAQRGKRNAVLDETVALVDARLELNRRKAA